MALDALSSFFYAENDNANSNFFLRRGNSVFMECSKLQQEKQLSRGPGCCTLLRRINYRTLVAVDAGNYGRKQLAPANSRLNEVTAFQSCDWTYPRNSLGYCFTNNTYCIKATALRVEMSASTVCEEKIINNIIKVIV